MGSTAQGFRSSSLTVLEYSLEGLQGLKVFKVLEFGVYRLGFENLGCRLGEGDYLDSARSPKLQSKTVPEAQPEARDQLHRPQEHVVGVQKSSS